MLTILLFYTLRTPINTFCPPPRSKGAKSRWQFYISTRPTNITFHICHLQTRHSGQCGHPVDDLLAGPARQRLLGHSAGRLGLTRLVPPRLYTELQAQPLAGRPQTLRIPPDQCLATRPRYMSSTQAQPTTAGQTGNMEWIHGSRVTLCSASDSHGSRGEPRGSCRFVCLRLLRTGNNILQGAHRATRCIGEQSSPTVVEIRSSNQLCSDGHVVEGDSY